MIAMRRYDGEEFPVTIAPRDWCAERKYSEEDFNEWYGREPEVVPRVVPRAVREIVPVGTAEEIANVCGKSSSHVRGELFRMAKEGTVTRERNRTGAWVYGQPTEPTARARAMPHLRAHPEGLTTAQLAALTGLDLPAARYLCNRLRTDGTVTAVRMPSDRGVKFLHFLASERAAK